MTISVGDELPEATFIEIGPEGPKAVPLAEILGSGKTVIFGVPGAYTPTCSSAHMPSFIRTKKQLESKGVDSIACVSVNDPFVMKAWGESTGASEAGIRMLADPASDFAKALGLEFSAPPAGLLSRSRRFSLVAEGGKVTHLNIEESPGVCELSGGESLLDQL
ncbi:peroxiredoxin [Algicella marina]|uniref:Glutathione-dependent peroxiredoxin n=1 Tax=Algicella marina TaxID=2683284 RepID=A0A6P1T5C8_9RHOB|nr:peroxiredoxin [Algicella marina]QHQ36479.1 redoxin family protein [Algicella marina]